jgi:excisionase family DNA binding protein
MNEKLTDILRGAKAIAAYLDLPETKVYRMVENGVIPAGRAGGRGPLIASKRRIAEALDKIASGETA